MSRVSPCICLQKNLVNYRSRKFSFGGNATNRFRNQDIKSEQMGGTVVTIPASNSLASSCELINRS